MFVAELKFFHLPSKNTQEEEEKEKEKERKKNDGARPLDEETEPKLVRLF